MTRYASPVLRSIPFALALSLASGCTPKEDEKKDDDKATKDDAKPDGKSDDGGDKDPEPAKGDDGGKADGGGIADVVDKAVPDALAPPPTGKHPERGSTLGWFIARNPEELLGKVAKQVLPSKYAMYADVSMLRTMAGAMGGPGAAVAKNIQADKPVGCALIESTVSDVPVACFFGYTGGAAAASTDVAEGKQADAKGHVAAHKFGSEQIFLDDLGDTVIATNHPELFDANKDFLEKTLLPYAKTQRDDVSMVAFPAPAVKRYDEQLAPLAAMTGGMGSETLAMYEEMEWFEYGFALEPDAFHIRVAVAGTPGSSYAEFIKAFEAGPLDPKWMEAAPASAWMAAAAHMRIGAMADATSMTAVRDMMIEGYAREVGKSASDVKTAVDEYVKENKELYGASSSFAVIHEPGTTGAIVVQYEKAKDGRESWKKWSESFTAESVLGKDGIDKVTWSFEEGAAEVDGVPVDRWVIEVKKPPDKDFEMVAKRFGGKLELTIDRMELDDRVVFVAALSDIEKNDEAALAAAKGTKTVADAPGSSAMIAAAPKTVALAAVDLKRMFAWLTELVPEKAPYPAVGNDFTDLTFVTNITGTEYDGDMALSQATIEQIKGLIP